ncbi:hypothetical protein [Nocardioides sp.]|uniref:hypothetical protein n=1 Tax=Nocardioides sp. TaxID=35761 RepID=UPI0035B497AE
MSITPHLARRLSATLTTAVLGLVMAVGLTSVGISAASAAPSTSSDRTVVGKSDQGRMKSTVVGRTSEGDKVSGTFTPTRFVQRDGTLWAKGFLEGKIHHDNGTVTKFSGIKKMPVKKINGQSATDARTSTRAAACDILNLVLGPLDLNVLGLEVHLQRVVLDVVAVAGAGQLLGNLLCAVAGLLDGTPLAGLLGQLVTLLNQILGALNLGV